MDIFIHSFIHSFILLLLLLLVLLGVLIGVIDGTDDQATVTLIRPLAQVESAKDIIATLGVSARTVLTRLKNPD